MSINDLKLICGGYWESGYIEDPVTGDSIYTEQCQINVSEIDIDKFTKLIIRDCADAADMAFHANCPYPGDYVMEQMNYSVEDRII